MEVKILSYNITAKMSSEKKVDKIMTIVTDGALLLLEGKLTPKEETNLIARSMEEINISKKFKGIEIAYIGTLEEKTFLQKVKNKVIELLLHNRCGITVIGPSKIVKEIKMDPNKLDILLR